MAHARKKYSNLAAAISHISALITKAAANGDHRILGVRHLSSSGGFSVTTCRKALKVLSSQGMCVVVPGGGVLLGSLAKPSGILPLTIHYKVPTPMKRWVEIRERVSSDMLSGAYSPGTFLPSAKQLAVRYGTSNAVLSAALRSLQSDGRIVRRRRRYQVPEPGRRSDATIVLIAHGESLLELIGFTPRSGEYLDCLERRCLQWNLRLQLLSFRDAVLWTPKAQKVLLGSRSAPVVGVLVWTLGLTANDTNQLAVNLHHTGLSSAILDETGRYPMPDIILKSPQFQCFVTACTRTAGTDVGRHLVNLGHRTVSFLSGGAEEPSTQNRLAGIQEYLVEHGRGEVRPVLLTGMEDEYGPAPPPDVAPYTEMRSLVSRFVSLVGNPRNNPNRRHFESEAAILAQQRVVQDRLKPHLESALDMRDITAWVADGDALAFLLLDFLETRRVPVPQRISVVGFDNVEDSMSVGLTTYSFNMPALVDAMLGHVLGSPKTTAKNKRPVIEVPGYVVDRRTCGAAYADSSRQ
jgi:DNA-binding transcriptional regulator YhcF (GntR family)